MAEGVEIKVDTRGARAKFARLTPAIRDEMRGVLPSLTKRLGSLVDQKLASGLKSRKTLTTVVEMHETTSEIYGRVAVTSPTANGLLPNYLEFGTKAHDIIGNPILAFEWPNAPSEVAAMFPKTFPLVFFHKVHRKEWEGLSYMQASLEEMQDEIVETIKLAAHKGAQGV